VRSRQRAKKAENPKRGLFAGSNGEAAWDDKVYRIENLKQAYAAVRANNGVPGERYEVGILHCYYER